LKSCGFATALKQHKLANSVPRRKGTSQRAVAFRLKTYGDAILLGWALIFFLLAIIAGYFGFFGLAGMAASIAKVLFLIFLVLLVVSFVVRALRGKSVV
jgi:uncharacterized membrane protein YtjA (UPF0391 family)